jgi:uncharacterized protein YndB with AHSA1/START domain
MNIVGTATIVIDRPGAEVWEWISDPENMHLWVHDVDEPGSWIDNGEPKPGSRYRIDYKYGRKTNEIIFEVRKAVLGETFVVDTVKGPYPILVEYGFEEANGGISTELSIRMNARSDSKFTAVLFVLTGWFAKWFMNRRLRNELHQVKIEIEKQ